MYAQTFYKLNLEIADARSKLLLNNEIADVRSTWLLFNMEIADVRSKTAKVQTLTLCPVVMKVTCCTTHSQRR